MSDFILEKVMCNETSLSAGCIFRQSLLQVRPTLFSCEAIRATYRPWPNHWRRNMHERLTNVLAISTNIIVLLFASHKSCFALETPYIIKKNDPKVHQIVSCSDAEIDDHVLITNIWNNKLFAF